MLSRWRLIDSGNCDPSFNMALDEAIFHFIQDRKSSPTLRFYGWNKTSLTIGRFQRTNSINFPYCKKIGIPIIRRPTGGRGVLHQEELTYSFSAFNEGVFSHGLFQTYYQISKALITAFKSLGIDVEFCESKRSVERQQTPFCFNLVSYSEITYRGYKIVGSAQKRTKKAFLQQGSIPYTIDNEKLKNIFNDHKVSMIETPTLMDLTFEFNLETLKTSICKAFERFFDITFIKATPSPEELTLAEKLATTKYKNLVS